MTEKLGQIQGNGDSSFRVSGEFELSEFELPGLLARIVTELLLLPVSPRQSKPQPELVLICFHSEQTS